MTEELEREDVDPARIALISDIFKTLTKTTKTFNVYPKGNPIYQKFALELSEKCNVFFNSNEDLPLNVEQFSLLYKGKEVYYSEDKTDNIALSLYVDGIREICFHNGISLEEIIDFIEILRIAPKEENVEDDIVTLLWEKDLEHVSYFVPEDIDESDVSTEEEIFPEEISAMPVASARPATSDMAVWAEAVLEEAEFLTADEIADVKRKAERMDRDYLLSSALDLFFELMSSERAESAFAMYLKNIEWVADLRIKEKDIQGLVDVLKRLSSFSDSMTNLEQKAAVSNAINGMGNIEIMRIVFGTVSDTDILTAYLSLLDDACTANMIEVLGELEDRKMRRFLCNILAGRTLRNMDAFEAGLEDARWFLVRNLVMILGMTKDLRAVRLIEKVRKHSEVRVRREVARALGSIHSSEAKAVLLTYLEDGDATVRIDALTALRRYEGNDLFSLLKKFIEREDFKEKSFNEKRELLGAFGEVGKEEAFPILSELFRRKGLFEREDAVELRACAAYGLGHVGTADAVSLLGKEVDSKKSVLRDACRNALNGTAGK